MAFPVKHFTSEMGGAPTLGDTAAGDFIGLLKACLVTGFNVTPIAEMTFDSETGEVTVDVGTGHGFKRWQVIEISGADQAAYNGEHRITAATEDSFTFVPETEPGTSPATGSTLEAKAAPVGGWTIEAEDSDNHKIALSRDAADATDHVLLIENTGYSGDSSVNGNFANVRICESFTDFDTFDSVASYWWAASHRYASAEWLLVADGHLLYWLPRYANPGKRAAFVWGDIETVRPGDAAHCLINGCDKSNSGEWDHSNDSPYTAFADLGANDYRGIARGHQQLPGEQSWSLIGIGGTMGASFSYPNPATNGFYVATGKLMVVEQSSLRGFMPGLLQPLHTSSVYHGAVVDNLPDLEGVPVLFWLATDSRNSGATERLLAWRLDEWFEEVGS